MIVLNSLEQLNKDTVVALGNFDGVHKGHQKLISKAVKLAKEQGLVSVVFTFTNLPLNEILGKVVVKNIFTPEQKIAEFEKLGVDIVVCIDFDKMIQTLSPEDFCKNILSETLRCKIAVCGFNYSFGYMGKGNPQVLTDLGALNGFEVFEMDDYKLNDQTVSSTLIRGLLSEGKVSEYEFYTGRKYTISGKVVQGNHLGRKLGFPTTNLTLDQNSALPKNGVYVTKIYVNNSEYWGITNIGIKPTVGNFEKNAESYLFDFDKDIYGEEIIVEFIDFIRSEMKFSSLDELKSQIKKDCENALQIKGFVL